MIMYRNSKCNVDEYAKFDVVIKLPWYYYSIGSKIVVRIHTICYSPEEYGNVQ